MILPLETTVKPTPRILAMASSEEKGPVGTSVAGRSVAGDGPASQGTLTMRQRRPTSFQGRDGHYRLLYQNEPSFRQLAQANSDFAAV
jgi:hypothetical protein